MKTKSKIILFTTSLSLAALVGCADSDSFQSATPTAAPAATVVGVFLDAPVEGLDYLAGSTRKGVTTAQGEFTCQEGDTVTFSLGSTSLGAAKCAVLITPMSLVGTTNASDSGVVNRLLTLQTLDDDGDPANGIKIAADVKAALTGRSIDFSASPSSFGGLLSSTLAAMPEKYRARSVDDTKRMLSREHFEDTLGSKTSLSSAETFRQTTSLGTIAATVTRYQVQAASHFYIPYEGSNSLVAAEFPKGFLPSYGSGLAFKGTNPSGDLEFYGLTDRGPNGDGPNVPALNGASGTAGSKIFPSPSFAPSFGIITVGKNGAVLTSSTPIRFSSAALATGLPLAPGTVGNSAEIPVGDSLVYNSATLARFSPFGLDTEAIAFDKARNALWVSDEYGPFILKIDAATGLVQKKYQPGTSAGDLPPVLLKRRANRGMEGLTLDLATGRLHGFLQSPLTDGLATGFYSATGKSERIERFARFTRWVEFDPETETSKMYAYPLDGSMYQDGRTGNAKLGDAVSIGAGKFIVIEQGSDPSGKVFNHLMLVQMPSNLTDINMAAFNPSTSDLEKSSMSAGIINGANFASVVVMQKTRLLDLNAIGWLAEKAEGLSLVDDFTLALANDNDFGLKTIITDGAGVPVAGADVTACNVNASGSLIASAGVGCAPGNAVRVGSGLAADKPNRLWLIKFEKKLSSLAVSQ